MDESVVKDTVDPVLTAVGTTVVSGLEDFGLLVLVLLITVHGWYMAGLSKLFATRFARFEPGASGQRTFRSLAVGSRSRGNFSLRRTLSFETVDPNGY
ncbi:hypothetical protein [Tropicimonas sp. IMCC6043]|uniref:hypothetical protein n=1 Tax=Tropicimonas sp. IMCC6043 TaxID=2510645 RepID=UPI00101B7AAE|nr:hypothetical protein [Tropicimonas sp. IMCC6043]RYH12326.1 hypothetical protein EU800_01845 [Tropicimonas sp. IMCC6043]